MTADLPPLTRDFTVAVFVVNGDQILLHFHQKLDRWLPPGGHIEPCELPDEAAIREVLEETGIEIQLVNDPINTVHADGQPEQLCRPAGVQLERIRSDHEHIDFVYFARAKGGSPTENSGWFGPNSWSELQLTEEVLRWCQSAIALVDQWSPMVTRVRT